MILPSTGDNLFSSVLSASQVLHPALNVEDATYIDINATYDPASSPAHLVLDSYAILYGSVANLILCPPGGRGRIFQEDYFCGLLSLLQEPFDEITANLIAMTLNTSLKTWEPRLANITVLVEPVDNPASYLVRVYGNIVNKGNEAFSAAYSVPAN